LLSHLGVLARQERYKDLLGKVEHRRLIRAAKPRPTGSGRLYRKVANWLGTKMVSWGYALLR
jgi:chromosome condensin MukBEF MukE localization factor